MAIDIGGMRKPYLNEKEAFDIKDLVSRDPYAQFTHWFEEAKKTAGIEEANAMCIGNFLKLCRTPFVLARFFVNSNFIYL